MSSRQLQIPGAHRVVKRLAGGRCAIYWYRHRGGPLVIRFEGATDAEALVNERNGQEQLLAAFAASRPAAAPMAGATVKDLIRSYRTSPSGFLKLAKSTRGEWSRWLDEIEKEFGSFLLRYLDDRRATAMIVDWRDRFANTPRKADYAIQVMRRLLSFGVRHGQLERNAAKGIESIYRSNRADIIIEDDELERILQHATRHAALAIRLAAATGMRRGDLVDLKWSELKGDRIERETNKSRRQTRLVCPLYGDAKAVIELLRAERQARVDKGKAPSEYVLVTARGGGWKPDSLTQAFERAAAKADVAKRLHDLRGTAVTRLKRQEFRNEEIARFVGWEPARVDRIIERYVDGSRLAHEAIDRLESTMRSG